jgi:hypothetical protein
MDDYAVYRNSLTTPPPPPVLSTKDLFCPVTKTLDDGLIATDFYMPPFYAFGHFGDHVVYHDGVMKTLWFLVVFCLSNKGKDVKGRTVLLNEEVVVSLREEYYLPIMVSVLL